MARTMDPRVLEMVSHSRNLSEFTTAYIKEFPRDSATGEPQYFRRISNYWSHRKKFRAEYDLTHKFKGGVRQETLPDVGEILILIHNQISELMVIQKERLEIVKKMSMGKL